MLTDGRVFLGGEGAGAFGGIESSYWNDFRLKEIGSRICHFAVGGAAQVNWVGLGSQSWQCYDMMRKVYCAVY